MHARPAAMLVETANRFKSNIYLEKDRTRINGKSIMGIITLGASYKSTLTVMAEGEDEEEAVATIFSLFENRFEED